MSWLIKLPKCDIYLAQKKYKAEGSQRKLRTLITKNILTDCITSIKSRNFRQQRSMLQMSHVFVSTWISISIIAKFIKIFFLEFLSGIFFFKEISVYMYIHVLLILLHASHQRHVSIWRCNTWNEIFRKPLHNIFK